MTATDLDNLRGSIAVYQEQQRYLLNLLAERGQLTADEFDQHFSEIYRGEDGKTCRRRGRWFWPFSPAAVILGGAHPTERSRMLDLMQHMILLGDIEVVKEDGVIVYRLPLQSQAGLS